jgi:hypothetical protein
LPRTRLALRKKNVNEKPDLHIFDIGTLKAEMLYPEVQNKF